MSPLVLERDYSIKLSSNIIDYIYPEYVFIPMYEGYKLKVRNNEIVKKEQVILSNADNLVLVSSVSGKIVGAKECIVNGKLQKCVVIENDFKEKIFSKSSMRKNIKQISKEMFLDILNTKCIVDQNDTSKLLSDLFMKHDFSNIVIKAFEDEIYMGNKIFLLQKHASEILEIISYLGKIFKTKNNVIMFKNNDRDNVELYTNMLGTYPEITLNLIPDVYPVTNELILDKYLYFKDDVLFITPENLLSIYYALKKDKIMLEKYITISGDAIVNPVVINTKIGASIKKIIDDNIKFLNNEEVVYIVNGLMTGYECNIDDLIVTEELDGIIINYPKKCKTSECINCGKCYEVCPANIDPKKIFLDNKNSDDINKCNDCGLCTYICPSYINFKNKIKELKDEK